MRNPFDGGHDAKQKSAEHRRNLDRWSRMDPLMARVLPTQDEAVQRVIGRQIEERWTKEARNSGELFPIHEKNEQGREVTRYEGDIRAAFEPFLLPSIKFELAPVVHYKGKSYLKSRVPPDVAREMLLLSNGFKP